MDWNVQTAAVISAIAVAAGYLAWRGWKTLRPGNAACGGGCCGPAKPAETTIRLSTLRLEKKA